MQDAEINLTPLIDVVFVVLVMFIVIVPILELDRVALAPGREDPHEMRSVRHDDPITIHVHADNTVWVRRTRVAPKDLQRILNAAKSQYPHATPQVFHDKSAQFGTYQMVKNACERAGFDKMDVILDPA